MDNLRSALVQNIFQIEANIPADAIEDLKWKYEKKRRKNELRVISCQPLQLLEEFYVGLLPHLHPGSQPQDLMMENRHREEHSPVAVPNLTD